MQPIKPFDFSKLNDELAKEYISIHNEICHELKSLRKLVLDKKSQDYLDVFLNQFKSVLVDPKFVGSTIVCISRSDLEKLEKQLESITNFRFSQEIITVSKLSALQYYKALEQKKMALEGKPKLSSDERKKLDKYKTKLTGTIKLFTLLLNIFDYGGRRKQLLKFYAKSQHQVCVYCLAQSTSIYRSKGKGKQFYLTGNLDHVKAKSHYPLFAVSLNNLVPVCGHCNQRKSNTKYKYDPFNPKHEHSFVFTNCLDYVKRSSRVRLKSLEKMQILPKDTDFSKLSEKLDFEELYQNFSGNAEILVERFHKFHSSGYKANIGKIFGKTVIKKNINAEMKYFISDIPLRNENVHKYPLTKFKMDLYDEVKRKYDQNKQI
jgi:hypothetical protein